MRLVRGSQRDGRSDHKPFQSKANRHDAKKTDIVRTEEVGKPSDEPAQGENGYHAERIANDDLPWLK
jgi:hypothetical protein